MALSAEDKAEVLGLVSTGTADFFKGETGKKLLVDSVASGEREATTKLTETVNGLAESVKKLGEANPGKGDPKDSDKGKPDPAADAVKAALEAALEAGLKPLNERFAAMDAEKSKAAETLAREALKKKTLTDEKYSALAKHKTFVRDLHARGVTKPEEVKAALAEFIADQKVLGVEIKPTAASPAGEGAKPGAGSGGDGKTLSIEEKRAKLKEIAKNTGPVPVGS